MSTEVKAQDQRGFELGAEAVAQLKIFIQPH
jgi:hypothetical protein